MIQRITAWLSFVLRLVESRIVERSNTLVVCFIVTVVGSLFSVNSALLLFYVLISYVHKSEVGQFCFLCQIVLKRITEVYCILIL